jgi:hypothetical protein
MDALTASAVVQRQDSYAAPPNYIGPPGRCQRIDDGRLPNDGRWLNPRRWAIGPIMSS